MSSLIRGYCRRWWCCFYRQI